MRKSLTVIIGVLAGWMMLVAGIAGAATVSAPIADGFAGPLQIAVGQPGGVYVAQDFAGVLTKLGKKGDRTDLVSAPGSEVAGVAAGGNGNVFYSTTFESQERFHAEVRRVLPNGKVSTLADVGAYEAAVNPDAGATYGFAGISADCAAQLPPEAGPPSYTGIVDSHPYALALAPDGGVLVADAAANDILRVRPNGRIETVAVLPPQPFVVTAEAAAANGFPDCTVGLTYSFEPVPTDVEVGPDGMLYVSLLPGGPEDPSLGARGAVYVVNPQTGASHKLAGGFAGATSLAVGAGGAVYVSELFADEIAVVRGGTTVDTIPLSQPAAVEYADGVLYASTQVFGNGAVVTITP
jgi:glucose/arabinose dehydrogenase